MSDVTVFRDIDVASLLRHFCLETEAEDIIKWCAENAPPAATARLRVDKAAELRQKGNQALAHKQPAEALHIYLAALHHLDLSEKDCMQDNIIKGEAIQREWHEALAVLLGNIAQACVDKTDAHNGERAADLGLRYADRLRTMADAQEARRAKLLYRRGLAKEIGGNAEEALADVQAACALVTTDKAMREKLSRLRAAAARERKQSCMRGMFGGTDPAPAAQPDEAKSSGGIQSSAWWSSWESSWESTVGRHLSTSLSDVAMLLVGVIGVIGWVVTRGYPMMGNEQHSGADV